MGDEGACLTLCLVAEAPRKSVGHCVSIMYAQLMILFALLPFSKLCCPTAYTSIYYTLTNTATYTYCELYLAASMYVAIYLYYAYIVWQMHVVPLHDGLYIEHVCKYHNRSGSQ